MAPTFARWSAASRRASKARRPTQAGTRWRDEGYWLLLPCMLLGLVWFRRGTTVRWVDPVPTAARGARCAPKTAAGSRNLWLTPDQQGRLAFDRGDYAQAAKLFADPIWRGIAAYRAYDFLAAAEAFARVETPDGKFALGNAQAHNHAYEKATKAYEEVLDGAARPCGRQERISRSCAPRWRLQEEKRRQQEQGQDAPDLPPDETRIDPEAEGWQAHPGQA